MPLHTSTPLARQAFGPDPASTASGAGPRSLLRVLAAAACTLAAAQAMATPVTIAYTGTVQTFTVATTGTYTISAGGAQGGHADFPVTGGLGAQVFGDFWLTAGTVLDIVVGGSPFSEFYISTGGGGGGSFVYTQLNQLLLAAGGGGGATFAFEGRDGRADNAGTAGVGQIGTTGGAGGSAGQGGGGADANGLGGRVFNGGGGGAGWLSNGAAGAGGGPSISGSGGLGRADGFAGGAGKSPGGFGGGGGAGQNGGGGGGGYSGGGGGAYLGGGGGGGSFVADVAVHTGGVSGAQAGNGYVSFDLLPAAADPNAVPEPGSLLLAASGLGALALLRRRPD